jgi:hypothetical protein
MTTRFIINAPDGVKLVSALLAGRQWWQLRASDIQGCRPAHAPISFDDSLQWIGAAWDGTSDISVAGLIICDTGVLISELRREISRLGRIGVHLPDANSVRVCLVRDADEPDLAPPLDALAVDIDFGDFILPIGIDVYKFQNRAKNAIEDIVDSMIRIIVYTAKKRKQVLARELRLRRVMEEIFNKMGRGTSPLWLRLEPFPFGRRAMFLHDAPYVAFGVALDQSQRWVPQGSERIFNMRELRLHFHYRLSGHPKRHATLLELRATGSQGWIDDVALALIKERDANPSEVFDAERVADVSQVRA